MDDGTAANLIEDGGMTDELRFHMGRHDEAIDRLQIDMAEVRRDIAEIKQILAQARGGWKTLLAVGSAAGAIGAAVAKGIAFLKGGA